MFDRKKDNALVRRRLSDATTGRLIGTRWVRVYRSSLSHSQMLRGMCDCKRGLNEIWDRALSTLQTTSSVRGIVEAAAAHRITAAGLTDALYQEIWGDMSTMTRFREVGLPGSNSREVYCTRWCHINSEEPKAIATRKIASIIDCCPPCSRKIAYGNNALIALRFKRIKVRSGTSTMVLSSWAMSVERSSTRALYSRIRKVGIHQIQTHLSSEIAIFETSQPRSIATTFRQLATRDGGDTGLKDSE